MDAASGWPIISFGGEDCVGYEAWFDFTDKVAVVVGGSGVLCGELARALGAQGAAVVVV